MFHPRGQPPGYQRAAWAAAGLPEPPGATSSCPLAEAVALHEARKQGHGEEFLAGAESTEFNLTMTPVNTQRQDTVNSSSAKAS